MFRFPALLFVALMSAAIPAQSSGEAYLIHETPRYASPTTLAWLRPNGTLSPPAGTLPWTFYPSFALNGPKNRTVWYLGLSNAPMTMQIGPSLLELRPGGSVATLVTGRSLGDPHVMIHGQDSDTWIISDSRQDHCDVLRWQGGKLTRTNTIRRLIPDGIARDPETGLLILHALDAKAFATGYFRVDPMSGAVTTIFIHPSLPPVSYRGATRLAYAGNGGFFDLGIYPTTQQMTVHLLRVSPGRFQRVSLLGANLDVIDLAVADGRAHPVRFRAVCNQFTALGGQLLFDIQSDGTVSKVTTIQSGGRLIHFDSPLLRIGANHLGWQLTRAPNDRLLRVSFPGEPHRPYIAAASLSGPGPGFALPDGRVVPLLVDALTLFSLVGGVPGLLENTVGILDAQGEARVRVTANRLGGAIRGVKVWFAAIVLDPAAPSGVARVHGPEIVVMR
jgi:hypothetical protein